MSDNHINLHFLLFTTSLTILVFVCVCYERSSFIWHIKIFVKLSLLNQIYVCS